MLTMPRCTTRRESADLMQRDDSASTFYCGLEFDRRIFDQCSSGFYFYIRVDAERGFILR